MLFLDADYENEDFKDRKEETGQVNGSASKEEQIQATVEAVVEAGRPVSADSASNGTDLVNQPVDGSVDSKENSRSESDSTVAVASAGAGAAASKVETDDSDKNDDDKEAEADAKVKCYVPNSVIVKSTASIVLKPDVNKLYNADRGGKMMPRGIRRISSESSDFDKSSKAVLYHGMSISSENTDDCFYDYGEELDNQSDFSATGEMAVKGFKIDLSDNSVTSYMEIFQPDVDDSNEIFVELGEEHFESVNDKTVDKDKKTKTDDELSEAELIDKLFDYAELDEIFDADYCDFSGDSFEQHEKEFNAEFDSSNPLNVGSCPNSNAVFEFIQDHSELDDSTQFKYKELTKVNPRILVCFQNIVLCTYSLMVEPVLI